MAASNLYSFCFRCLDALPVQSPSQDTEQAQLTCGHANCYHAECLVVLRRSGQSCPCQNSRTPACSALAHVLQATRADKTFQTHGVRALAALTAHSTELTEELLDLDLFSLVCDDLGNYTAELPLQRCGHQALQAFLTVRPSLIEKLLEAGFCPKVCWSMSRFPEDQELAVAGCHVMGAIAAAEPAASVHLFELSEGPRLVCEAAKQFMQNPAMQRAALEAIHGLAWGLVTGTSQLMEKKAPRILLEIMARNGSDRAMIKMGLRTISSMAPGQGADQVGGDGGCALLTKLLSKYGEDLEMVAAILDALANLTANSPANRTRMGTDASVATVLKAMAASPQDAGVQLQCCRLITFVSQDKANVDAKERFGAAGCCAALLRMLTEFGPRKEERDVLLWCTRAMMALISYSPANQARLMDSGAEATLTDLAKELAAASQEQELTEAMQVVLGGLGLGTTSGPGKERKESTSHLASPTALGPATTAATAGASSKPAVPKIGPLGRSLTSPSNLQLGPASARNKTAEFKRQNSARRDSESILARARAELAKMQNSGGAPAVEEQGEEGAGGKVPVPMSARGSGAGVVAGTPGGARVRDSYGTNPPGGEEEGKGKPARMRLHLSGDRSANMAGETMDGLGGLDTARRTELIGTYGPDAGSLVDANMRTTASRGSLLIVTARRQGSRSMIVVDPTAASFTASSPSPNAVPALSGIAKAITSASNSGEYGPQPTGRAPQTARGSVGMAALGTLNLAPSFSSQDPAMLTARGGLAAAQGAAPPMSARGQGNSAAPPMSARGPGGLAPQLTRGASARWQGAANTVRMSLTQQRSLPGQQQQQQQQQQAVVGSSSSSAS